MTEREGYVKVIEKKNSKRVVVENEEGKKKTYKIPYGSKMIIKDDDYVTSGDKLTEGPLDPNVLLKVKGEKAVQNYLLEEVQNVYRSQGVEINDKHIEVIVRQMMKKLKVIKPGDTDLLPGSLVNRYDFREANKKAAAKNNETASAKPELLGITKASLATDSFLSAASFQETTRVLTEASLEGKVDPLMGLKENVIIGQLIPAGTGMDYYRDIDLVKEDGTLFDDLTETLEDVE
jgi:DNA-directed RNA polymerase subunit beta'